MIPRQVSINPPMEGSLSGVLAISSFIFLTWSFRSASFVETETE